MSHTVTVPARRVYRVGDADGASCTECDWYRSVTHSMSQRYPWAEWRQGQRLHERGTGHKTVLFAYNWPKVNEGSSV